VGERVERRLAAILAADVAGYSALMERDEEGTFARIRSLRREVIEPHLAEHLGRLIKTTGDGFLAEFGSPIAALRCALAIQGVLANDPSALRLRVGLNLGDVIIEEGGDVFGEGINVAARLEALAEPGGILISDKIHREVEGKVEAYFDDRGEQQVKNITRPVRIYAVCPAGVTSSSAAMASALEISKPLRLPEKPSLAILPFQNMSGDPEQEHFADGMVEDIITALSRVKSFFVIARNSSFTYKGRAVDVKQVGRELGVRYVMEGSVRKSNNRIRVTAQLIEASTGRHIWAEKYDRLAEDVFDIQDDLTQSVCAATQTHLDLDDFEVPDRSDRPDLQVWLLSKRSWLKTYLLTPDALSEARKLAEQAVKLGPESGRAHEALSGVLIHQVFMRTIHDGGETLRAARRSAEKAVQSEGASEYAYWALGMVQFTQGETDQAILTLKHGLQINPNCALLTAAIGNYLALVGKADESIAATELAMRINPRDPSIFFRYQALADAFFVKRDFQQMVDWAAKAATAKPSYFAGHTRLLVGLALLNKPEAAKAARERYFQEIPEGMRTTKAPFAREEDSLLFQEGLRKAGLA
jgi:adenylate cyclase